MAGVVTRTTADDPGATKADRGTAADRGAQRHVVVVGGGLAGLVAAWQLVTAERADGAPALRVSVLEQSPRLGGKLASAEVAGITIEAGAESVLARRPEFGQLTKQLGLADSMVHPATSGASLWTRGALRPLPPSLMGVPTDLRALAASGVLTPAELARVGWDLVLGEQPRQDDTDVATVIGSRLGYSVVDALVEPLLGGVYAGHAGRLSFAATIPQLAGYTGPSLLQAAAAAIAPAAADQPTVKRRPVFAGLEGGLGRLPGVLADRLLGHGVAIYTDSPVRALLRTPVGYDVVVGSASDTARPAPRLIHADAVVIALPGHPAARLLAEVSPPASLLIDQIEYASVALIAYAFASADLPELPTGTGFLVPPSQGRSIKAATYATQKWAWLDKAADDTVIVRVSVGRAREEQLLQRDDLELIALGLTDLTAALGERLPPRTAPLDATVIRWGGALPQYAVGHLDRVAGVRAALREQPRLTVAGAALDGVGIPAVIASARTAAHQILAELGMADAR